MYFMYRYTSNWQRASCVWMLGSCRACCPSLCSSASTWRTSWCQHVAASHRALDWHFFCLEYWTLFICCLHMDTSPSVGRYLRLRDRCLRSLLEVG